MEIMLSGKTEENRTEEMSTEQKRREDIMEADVIGKMYCVVLHDIICLIKRYHL